MTDIPTDCLKCKHVTTGEDKGGSIFPRTRIGRDGSFHYFYKAACTKKRYFGFDMMLKTWWKRPPTKIKVPDNCPLKTGDGRR